MHFLTPMKRLHLALLFTVAIVPGALAAFVLNHSGTTSTSPPATWPSGVTTAAIDGETMISGPEPRAMTHTYYSAFANAASGTYNTTYPQGWNSLNFIPFGPFDSDVAGTPEETTWAAVGWQTMFNDDTSTTLSLMRANGWYEVQNWQGPIISGSSTETVGLLSADDNAGTYAECCSGPLSSTSAANQNGRLWWYNTNWQQITGAPINGAPGGTVAGTFLTPVTIPGGSTRHIDAQSSDLYAFGGCNNGAYSQEQAAGQLGAMYDQSTTQIAVSQSQCTRGSSYGDVISAQRLQGVGEPLYTLVEDGQPYTVTDPTGNTYITPPQLNWAVWSSYIHGARGTVWFDHTFGGPNQCDLCLQSGGYYTTIQAGQTVSIFTQVTNTNALVAQMAPQLNSPKAIGYATVSPAGYTSDDDIILTSPPSFAPLHTSGIEIRTVWDGSNFYIFADTRDDQSTTGISATFTLNDPAATSVNVIGESRSIPVVSGFFTDTFAKASTVHIYQVIR